MNPRDIGTRTASLAASHEFYFGKRKTMANNETIAYLGAAKDKFVRAALARMLDNYGADELIQLLAEVIDDYARDIAMRRGEYERAAALAVMVKHLEGLDAFIENYDPTPE